MDRAVQTGKPNGSTGRCEPRRSARPATAGSRIGNRGMMRAGQRALCDLYAVRALDGNGS